MINKLMDKIRQAGMPYKIKECKQEALWNFEEVILKNNSWLFEQNND